MLQIIFVVCVIATVLLLIFRKSVKPFWIYVSPLIGLTGGFLSIVFAGSYLTWRLLIAWTIGLPMLLVQSVNLYKEESNPTQKSNESYIRESGAKQSSQIPKVAPLRDNIFSLYAGLLTSILLNSQYSTCGYTVKMKLEREFLLCFGNGKGNNQIPQDFPFQDFIRQANFYISSIGLENILKQLKTTASDEEIKFCKTNLMNFASTCRIATANQAPVQHATYICNYIGA